MSKNLITEEYLKTISVKELLLFFEWKDELVEELQKKVFKKLDDALALPENKLYFVAAHQQKIESAKLSFNRRDIYDSDDWDYVISLNNLVFISITVKNKKEKELVFQIGNLSLDEILKTKNPKELFDLLFERIIESEFNNIMYKTKEEAQPALDKLVTDKETKRQLALIKSEEKLKKQLAEIKKLKGDY